MIVINCFNTGENERPVEKIIKKNLFFPLKKKKKTVFYFNLLVYNRVDCLIWFRKWQNWFAWENEIGLKRMFAFT